MADEIKKDSAETPAKETETKKKDASKKAKADKADAPKEKKPNVFVRMGKSIKKFFKDLRGECKKVVWPDAKTVLKSTGVVLASVAVLGVIIWGIDTGLSELIKLLLNTASNASATTETTTAANVTGSIISGFFGL